MLKDEISNVFNFQQRLFDMSSISIQTFCTHCLCSHTSFSSSHHKQFIGDLKCFTLVMVAVHDQVALMSSSQSEPRLLLPVTIFTICHNTALICVSRCLLCIYIVAFAPLIKQAQVNFFHFERAKETAYFSSMS